MIRGLKHFSHSFLCISDFHNVKVASTNANMRTNYSANFSSREIFKPNLRLFEQKDKALLNFFVRLLLLFEYVVL